MALYYVAHRLFAAHDRALGAYIATRLAREAGADSVFLPFCDTDEENLAAPVKGRLLFELDCARLRGISGMIALLHGPSLDDGVCMEIGFAAASGVSVVAVTTDFQTYQAAPGTPPLDFPDPLLGHVASAIIRASRLGAPPPDAGRHRLGAFLGQNLAPARAAARQATDALLALAAAPADGRAGNSARRRDLAYVEPSPYIDDPLWDEICAELRRRGWQVHVASRLRAGPGQDTRAAADWAAATAAALAVVDARGPETPPGAALVTGALTAAGLPGPGSPPRNLADAR